MVQTDQPSAEALKEQQQQRGKFIVFEGLDRCGKTTQSGKLCQRLEEAGQTVKRICFPDRTTVVGKMIDAYLKSSSNLSNEAIHLLFSVNRWEFEEKIRQDLKDGYTVVSDRYAFSGVAYSSAKGMDFQWCKNPDRGLPEPDLVIFLHADPEEVQNRSDYGEERYEKVEFQKKVKAQLEKFGQDSFWYPIKATQEVETIHEEIWTKVNKLEVSKEPRKLWMQPEPMKPMKENDN